MSKRKLTRSEKREKKRRRELFETIFIGGKQKRVRRSEALIGGVPEDEFIAQNADPIWLHQHGRWELLKDDPENNRRPDQRRGEGEAGEAS